MKIVAVTACPAGLMHTFMAAKGLENAVKNTGDSIKVETQSASGIAHEITQQEIDQAEVVILAIDISIEGRERFNGKPILTVSTSKVLKNASEVLEDAKKLIEVNDEK